VVGIVIGIQLTNSFFYCCLSLSVASIVTESNRVSESESEAESTVQDVGKPFTLIELVHQGHNVSDEKKDACLDLATLFSFQHAELPACRIPRF